MPPECSVHIRYGVADSQGGELTVFCDVVNAHPDKLFSLDGAIVWSYIISGNHSVLVDEVVVPFSPVKPVLHVLTSGMCGWREKHKMKIDFARHSTTASLLFSSLSLSFLVVAPSVWSHD